MSNATAADSAAEPHYKVPPRRCRPAEDVLASYLERFTDSSDEFYLGYVGEWHTHPLPAPPSLTDQAAMRTMARRNRHPVAIVVVARHDDTAVSFHGLVSAPATPRNRLAGRHVASPVRTD